MKITGTQKYWNLSIRHRWKYPFKCQVYEKTFHQLRRPLFITSHPTSFTMHHCQQFRTATSCSLVIGSEKIHTLALCRSVPEERVEISLIPDKHEVNVFVKTKCFSFLYSCVDIRHIRERRRSISHLNSDNEREPEKGRKDTIDKIRKITYVLSGGCCVAYTRRNHKYVQRNVTDNSHAINRIKYGTRSIHQSIPIFKRIKWDCFPLASQRCRCQNLNTYRYVIIGKSFLGISSGNLKSPFFDFKSSPRDTESIRFHRIEFPMSMSSTRTPPHLFSSTFYLFITDLSTVQFVNCTYERSTDAAKP